MTADARRNDSQPDVRIEHDLIGPKEVPANVYYGVQTARAMENFNISGVPINHYPHLIRALAMVKLACARANFDVHKLSAEILAGIERACFDLIEGQHHDQFVLDVLQGGAGTSTNMNANEVIANIALEHMGHTKGEYRFCDPHDHVNKSQSTNDVYPSALHLALLLGNVDLIAEFRKLIDSIRMKADEFSDIVKMGRTQLQDAVPMTLGQEFLGWANSLEDELDALQFVEQVLHEVNLGGTAIGTGLNAPRGYAQKSAEHLAEISRKPMHLARNLVEATQDTQAFVLYSSTLKSLAIKLSKICNDMRLLSSGPRTGINEINLPALQPGSTIMPGKVNPVMPEVVNMVCFRVIGNDLTVTMAAEAGQLQLNVMEPVIAACLLESQTLFMNAGRSLRTFCIDGITANRDVCQRYIEQSIGVVTALNPLLGYEKATVLAGEAMHTGKGIVQLVREQQLLTEEQIQQVLNPANMTGRSSHRE
jgi:aspartate ammonia-lyase